MGRKEDVGSEKKFHSPHKKYFHINEHDLLLYIIHIVTCQKMFILLFDAINEINISNKANRGHALRQGKILRVSREIVYFMNCIVNK